MSNIKGGGRAALSDSAEEALISLLMPSNDNIRSEHDRKREHKRFLKTLVERYERQKLANTLNNNSETTSLPRSCGNKKNYATAKQKQQSDAKVRVELVEAVYGKDNKKGKHSDSFFKDGTKKAMVFPISTTVAELIKQAQSKLRMKKPPIRAFVKENKIDRALSMDLTGDLSGVQNGAIIYVTSTASSPKGEDKINNVQVDDSMPDPLDAVKQAYNARRNYHRHNRRQTRARTTLEHPSFSDHFDKLIQLSEERANLPAASCREHILRSVQDNRVVVICGATGCGKSTQVPQFLFEGMTAAGQGQDANILVTQPRRVAAISLAQRVSCEIKDSAAPGKPGSQVGYNVRLDRAVTNDAKIVYCTVGILLRMLVCPQEEADEDGTNNDVPLSNLSHVVIDEVHERDVNTDFVLTLLRALLRRNRHIRIILMSATASASLFVNYFVGHLEKAPVVIDIPGRSFPVNIKWLSDCENFASSRIQFYNDDIEEKNNVPSRVQSGDSDGVVLSPRATDKIDNQFIRKLICAIVREEQQRTTGKQSTAPSGKRTDGAILVFLPGKGEIEALGKVLIDDSTLGHQDVCKILKLHSTIPRGGQQVVFQPALEGTVKIVLATNIAETSITIPDVSHVIDAGRVKESRFNPSTRIKELVTVWTSQASTKQRAGRAGRTCAGFCWRLFSDKFATTYTPEQTSPEIVRTPLDELVLQVCLLYEQRRDEQNTKESITRFPVGASPIKFLNNTPEPPPEKSLEEACDHLLEVDALRIVNKDGPILYRLTPLGYHLSRLPMDAKVGKVLIVGCMLECLDNALTVAATLSCTKSCFFNRWGNSNDKEWKSAVMARESLVENGFGGRDWRGGTVKGDLIAAISVFRAWTKKKGDKERASFCRYHALDHVALKEIDQLRGQFLDCLADAGFVTKGFSYYNGSKDDALLTSCCLVAGLHPNIFTLMRPRMGGPKGGRLLTKDGDVARPSSNSFQKRRVDKTAETGKDAYGIYHSKNRSLGVGERPGQIFLSEVNFVSRFALLLFGGELDVKSNAIIVDDWLKFKIADRGAAGAVLLLAFRDELDKCMVEHIVSARREKKEDEGSQQLMKVLRQLLADE